MAPADRRLSAYRSPLFSALKYLGWWPGTFARAHEEPMHAQCYARMLLLLSVSVTLNTSALLIWGHAEATAGFHSSSQMCRHALWLLLLLLRAFQQAHAHHCSLRCCRDLRRRARVQLFLP